MTNVELINNMFAGGMLGIIGQGIRVVIGLKKLSDANTVNVAQNAPIEGMSTSRILTSIFIGFVAGALALIVKGAGGPDISKGLETQSIITTVAIGYSGADFIEGFFSTYINKSSAIANTAAAATTTTSTAPATQAPSTQEANFEDEFAG